VRGCHAGRGSSFSLPPVSGRVQIPQMRIRPWVSDTEGGGDLTAKAGAKQAQVSLESWS
jgi:hypothetical protein